MSAALENATPALAWTEAGAVPVALRPGSLWDWLVDDGSLTQRLRAAAGTGFGLARLGERFEDLRAADAERMGLAPPQRAWLREVVLTDGGRPFIYAITVIPESTLAAHRWLAELGDRPLGEAVFAAPDASREPLEVARLAAAHPLAARALRATGVALEFVWARRSVLRVARRPLLVHECFVAERAG
jgi:chorismate--pyruvate lyase